MALVVILAFVTHQFRWQGLRFVTSEGILRLSSQLGMESSRLSGDTIRINGELFQFTTSCTFIDVFLPSIALLWSVKRSVARNSVVIAEAAVYMLVFNLARLELGHILYSSGVAWVLADDILGGLCYFAVWLALWKRRDWGLGFEV